jgi:hypothetical protein
MPRVSKASSRHNHIGGVMKDLRDNEKNVSSQGDKFVGICPQNKPNDDLLSKVLESVIRYLNFRHDKALHEGDIELAEACLDRKARLIIQLLMIEHLESGEKKYK